MAQWFPIFLIYSFFGYCLEKLFARAVHSERQTRKCFVFLPLCPVYGVGMLAVLRLIDPRSPFFAQVIMGGILCTAAEYFVHLFYDSIFQVKFWDYSSLPAHMNGRICPQFALIWGFLSAAAARFIHPAVSFLAASFPRPLIFALFIVFSADCALTAAVLRQYHDTELLSLSALADQQRSSSQDSTSR